jgi:hypothetical protein
MRKLYLFTVISFVLAACTPASNRPEVTPTATRPACQPSLKQTSNAGFPEIQGTMESDGEMWALLFFDQAHPKVDEKIVWRITGTGYDFSAWAQSESGASISPIWGPDYHDSSTWNHPGEEWGTGFNFPEPGCWKITVRRGATTGEIRLEVLASQ